jgi:hypothetical protein
MNGRSHERVKGNEFGVTVIYPNFIVGLEKQGMWNSVGWFVKLPFIARKRIA